jgi:SAM-dependent methyltransferase
VRRELLIGSGNSRKKDLYLERGPREFEGLVTLDIDPNCGADVIHDLESVPLPFPDNEFDEIHAYEVLEHVGRQGDWRFFFAQFQDFWRILKPGGYFFATCPAWHSPWAWGDPGHTRVLSKESLIFLQQREYAVQIGKTTMTDYRSVYTGDFEVGIAVEEDHRWGFILRAIK